MALSTMSDDGSTAEIIPPRPRGRPRKASNNPDPALLDITPDAEQPSDARKKRPASRKSKADKIAEMAEDIKGAHELAAIMLGMPFLAIPDDKAMRLAKPAYETAAKYGWDGGIGPELKLAFAMASVYGPLAFQVNLEVLRRKSQAARPAEAPRTAPQAQPATAAAASPGSNGAAPGMPHIDPTMEPPGGIFGAGSDF